jgi:transposase
MAYDRSQDVPRRRRWPEAEKRRLVAEVEAGGRPVVQVAAEHDVHPSLLARWVGQFGRQAGAVLVPVQVQTAPAETAPPSRSGQSVEVHLASGRRLIVAEDIAPERLRVLVAVVEAA